MRAFTITEEGNSSFKFSSMSLSRAEREFRKLEREFRLVKRDWNPRRKRG